MEQRRAARLRLEVEGLVAGGGLPSVRAPAGSLPGVAGWVGRTPQSGVCLELEGRKAALRHRFLGGRKRLDLDGLRTAASMPGQQVVASLGSRANQCFQIGPPSGSRVKSPPLWCRPILAPAARCLAELVRSLATLRLCLHQCAHCGPRLQHPAGPAVRCGAQRRWLCFFALRCLRGE